MCRQPLSQLCDIWTDGGEEGLKGVEGRWVHARGGGATVRA